MTENSGDTSLKKTLITTCGGVAVAIVGAVGTYFATNKSSQSPAEPPAISQPELKANPLLDPNSTTWLVQLGFFQSKANALARKEQLEQAGISDVKIVKADEFPGLNNPNGNYVVLGPLTETQAIEILDKAKNQVPDAIVVNGYHKKP